MHAQKALIEISFNTLKGIKGLVESQNRHSAKQVNQQLIILVSTQHSGTREELQTKNDDSSYGTSQKK